MKLSRRTSIVLAEVAFLLIVIGGVWLAAAGAIAPPEHLNRTTVAGFLFAIAGALLIVAARWGRLFDQPAPGEDRRDLDDRPAARS